MPTFDPKMVFKDIAGPRWARQAQVLLSDAAVRSEVDRALGFTRMPQDFPMRLASAIDGNMMDYALNWSAASRLHKDSGVYRELARHSGYGGGDLVLDIGCGSGELLAELRPRRGIGVDINPYCLQLAEQTLEHNGVSVQRHSGVSLEHALGRGFFVSPDAHSPSLPERGVVLVADDARSLRNTCAMLAASREKAGAIYLTLTGGGNVGRAGEYGKRERDSGLSYSLMESLLEALPEIAMQGSRVYFAVRGMEMEVDGDEEDPLDSLVEKYGDRVSLRLHREIALPLAEAAWVGFSVGVPGSFSPKPGGEVRAPRIYLYKGVVK